MGMTEAEWVQSENPNQMLYQVEDHVTNRKKRLFSCACLRHVPAIIGSKLIRRAVETCERYADKLATRDELGAAYNPPARSAWDPAGSAWDSMFQKIRYRLPT